MMADLFTTEQRGARLSECGRYRYTLTRQWGDGMRVCWVMLNPSTADATDDDPTIKRVRGFTRAWGYSGFIVVNLFAWRATKPAELLKVADPVGPDNDVAIAGAVESSAAIIAAWGTVHKKLRWRAARVRSDITANWSLHYLRLSNDGAPWHPLYLPADLKPVHWK